VVGLRPSSQRVRAARLERLTPLDLSNLRVEDHGLPVHVAALLILDGAPLLDAVGQLRLESVRANVGQRLHRAPRLRQVLAQGGFGLGPPAWVDDPGFDVAEHVRTREVPSPGDEAALLRVCSQLNEPPLDRSRPLWEMWLLTGLADGTVGMLIRLHHVVADGTAALAMIGALFDPGSDTPTEVAPAWVPAPGPGSGELFSANVRDRARAVAGALALVRRPSVLFGRLAVYLRQVRQLAREGLAPRVSLNRQAGKRRRLLLVRANLEDARTVAHGHGGKVNDVVLAALAGGVRNLLDTRGELRPGLVIKASVAVSLRGAASERASGNLVGVMLVPLPVSEPDPARRLEEISKATAERKRQPPYQPSARFLQRWMVRLMSRQRLVNLLVSDLAGPASPMFFTGSRVREMFQVGVVQGNITVSVGVLSYAGQLNFTIVADADAAPDLPALAAGLSADLRQLAGPAPGGPASPD